MLQIVIVAIAGRINTRVLLILLRIWRVLSAVTVAVVVVVVARITAVVIVAEEYGRLRRLTVCIIRVLHQFTAVR